jgi:hypothetical protein
VSLLRPTPPPADPIGSKLDIHVSGISAVVTFAVLTALNATLFRHSTPPADMGYVVSTAVSYAVSQVSGRLTRSHLLKRVESAVEPAAAAAEGELPGTAMPRQ